MRFTDIDFVVVGAAKSATTWLQTQLQADPAIYMPDPELHYFSREYDRGEEWYLSQFDGDLSGKTVGEKSNSYLYESQSAERMHRVMPHVKLIAQLRNPVERAYSNYCMLFRRGDVGSDIESYLDPVQSENFRLLVAGNFASHLQGYIDLFGRERLLILFFEGVLQDPQKQISRVRDHLGLPPRQLAPAARRKVKDKAEPVVPAQVRKRFGWMKPIVRPLRGTSAFETIRASLARETEYPPLTEDLRKRLNDYFGPSIEALEKMSGHSLSHWYRPMDRAR
ncbi:sulfotransferase family protein [Aurantiacibacter hainanensis]|uniref:sulfotransferase family protein n=1 Tax=Aurantiacibacter hainanensis TaxID=3076114 RepID=UPI0030C6C285